jgi:uncharacterized protein (TIGR01319 family)
VHSIASGNPQRPDIITAGLPEPYEKRTVEGDLGLKYNLDTIVEILKSKGLTTCNVAAVKSFAAGKLPQTAEEIACHRLLTKLVIETAVNRHAGRIEETYGKDLTGVGCLIGTGGAMAFSTRPEELLKAGLYSEINAASLKPKHPQFWLDEKYILYAVGLLSQSEPEKAFILAKKYLKRIG